MNDSMARILQEERQRPTISYKDNWSDLKEGLGGSPLMNFALLSAVPYNRPTIHAMREQKVRLVSEKPQLYSFGGGNYETLLLLFNQVSQSDRDDFIEHLLTYVESGGYCTRISEHRFPKFEGFVSDLPLIAEFCVRQGYTERLFASTEKCKAPTPGLALMMMQLEETIALNFTLFSKQQLKDIQTSIRPLYEMAELQTYSERGSVGKMVKNPHFKPGRSKEADQIVLSIRGIVEECDQAIFFYIRDALQQSRSFEVESDKQKVACYLKDLGFDPLLQEALDRAEKEFRDDATGFELKTCMSHLRSFLEQLHAQACAAIATEKTPVTEYNKWGLTIAFLKKHEYISSQEEKFVSGIHAIMSEDGVHPLIAEREYVRLLRNVVIEYGLLLMSILDKKGIKIAAPTAIIGEEMSL
ncbi:MAG: hypothetical protein WCE63_05570 [Acidobacteriaceae bacterium]